MTLAVAPEEQGKGYGTAIYRDLARCGWPGGVPGVCDAPESVWALIKKTNLASLGAIMRAPFIQRGVDGDGNFIFQSDR